MNNNFPDNNNNLFDEIVKQSKAKETFKPVNISQEEYIEAYKGYCLAAIICSFFFGLFGIIIGMCAFSQKKQITKEIYSLSPYNLMAGLAIFFGIINIILIIVFFVVTRQ